MFCCFDGDFNSLRSHHTHPPSMQPLAGEAPTPDSDYISPDVCLSSHPWSASPLFLRALSHSLSLLTAPWKTTLSLTCIWSHGVNRNGPLSPSPITLLVALTRQDCQTFSAGWELDMAGLLVLTTRTVYVNGTSVLDTLKSTRSIKHRFAPSTPVYRSLNLILFQRIPLEGQRS